MDIFGEPPTLPWHILCSRGTAGGVNPSCWCATRGHCVGVQLSKESLVTVRSSFTCGLAEVIQLGEPVEEVWAAPGNASGSRSFFFHRLVMATRNQHYLKEQL